MRILPLIKRAYLQKACVKIILIEAGLGAIVQHFEPLVQRGLIRMIVIGLPIFAYASAVSRLQSQAPIRPSFRLLIEDVGIVTLVGLASAFTFGLVQL